MDERKLTISFSSDYNNVDLVRAAIKGICEKIIGDLEGKSLAEDFTLAITEAMNNAVEHSGSQVIEIELIISKNEFLFRMLTKGEEFDPTVKVSMPALNDSENLPEGGFGRAILQQLTDSLQHEYLEGKNILTVKKIFPYGLDRKLEERKDAN